MRTEWNVRDSDGTLVIRASAVTHSDAATEEAADPGTEWAMQCAGRYSRPFFICDPSDAKAQSKIREWLDGNPISTLNVAGSSEGTSPGIGERAYALLLEIFSPDRR